MLSFMMRICLRSDSNCSFDSVSSLVFSAMFWRSFVISVSLSRIHLISSGSASCMGEFEGGREGERETGHRNLILHHVALSETMSAMLLI